MRIRTISIMMALMLALVATLSSTLGAVPAHAADSSMSVVLDSVNPLAQGQIGKGVQVKGHLQTTNYSGVPITVTFFLKDAQGNYMKKHGYYVSASTILTPDSDATWQYFTLYIPITNVVVNPNPKTFYYAEADSNAFIGEFPYGQNFFAVSNLLPFQMGKQPIDPGTNYSGLSVQLN